MMHGVTTHGGIKHGGIKRSDIKNWCKLVACALLVLLASPIALLADEFRPALLEITEREGGWVDVTWKVPMLGNRVLNLKPVLPEFFKPVGPGSGRPVPGAWWACRRLWSAFPRPECWCQSLRYHCY